MEIPLYLELLVAVLASRLYVGVEVMTTVMKIKSQPDYLLDPMHDLCILDHAHMLKCTFCFLKVICYTEPPVSGPATGLLAGQVSASRTAFPEGKGNPTLESSVSQLWDKAPS